MISLMDCVNAIGANRITKKNGITHKHIWCLKGHKLGSGHIRNEDIYKNKPLVCRICQECPGVVPFDIPYVREE